VTFGVQKLEWFGYSMVKNSDDTFIRFDRIHERDRRMPHDGIGHACIALRAKTRMVWLRDSEKR